MMTNTKKNLVICLISACIAIPFLLVYAIYVSPIASRYGYDAAFFELIGRGMVDGLVPYIDFHDMKGPYLFFLEWFGQSIYRGRTGCFIMECFLLTISIALLFKLVQLALESKGACAFSRVLVCGAVTTVVCLIPFAITLEGGNLPEELSLPFLLAALYCNMKYFVELDAGTGTEYKASWAFVNGFAVCVMAFIRVTNAAFILTTLLCIMIAMIRRGAITRFLRALVWFFAGMLAAAIPVLAYCLGTNSLDAMFLNVFAFGFMYAGDSLEVHADELFNGSRGKLPRLMILGFIPVIATAFLHPKKAWCWGVSVLGVLATFVAIFLGYGFIHYAGILIPLMAYGAFLFFYRDGKQERIAKGRIVAALVLCLALVAVQVPGFLRVTSDSAKAISYHFTVSKEDKIAPTVHEVIAHIPEDERDSVLLFGKEAWSRWYCIEDIYPTFKCFDNQEGHFRHDPSLEQDLRKNMLETPARWVVVKAGYEKISPGMAEAIHRSYEEVAREGDFTIYRLKD